MAAAAIATTMPATTIATTTRISLRGHIDLQWAPTEITAVLLQRLLGRLL